VNDKGDFELFVASRSTVLLRTAYLLCAGDRGAAEDLLQDVLERMYPKWRRIKGNPEAYARVALANASANRWRTRSRRVRETPLTTAPPQPVRGPEKEVLEYAYRIGQDRRNVLAFELDQPQYLSDQVVYDNAGKPRRTWQKMESRDGMVLGRLPYGDGPDEPSLAVGDPARPGVEHLVPILGDTIDMPKTEPATVDIS
jgi:hypothetical protein